MHTFELKYRMSWSGATYNKIIKKVTKYKTELKLRNQTFVWTDKFRNVMELLKCVLSRLPRLENNVGSTGTLEKSHKPFENDKKMKVAKQATTKKSFLSLSSLEISIVVTAIVPKDEGDYNVNDSSSRLC